MFAAGPEDAKRGCRRARRTQGAGAVRRIRPGGPGIPGSDGGAFWRTSPTGAAVLAGAAAGSVDAEPADMRGPSTAFGRGRGQFGRRGRGLGRRWTGGHAGTVDRSPATGTASSADAVPGSVDAEPMGKCGGGFPKSGDGCCAFGRRGPGFGRRWTDGEMRGRFPESGRPARAVRPDRPQNRSTVPHFRQRPVLQRKHRRAGRRLCRPACRDPGICGAVRAGTVRRPRRRGRRQDVSGDRGGTARITTCRAPAAPARAQAQA
jgi:hypothetical protein